MNKIAHGNEVVEYDFYAEKVVRTGVPAGLTAETVIDNYVTAIGGADKLKAIKDMALQASMKIQGMELSLNTFHKAPNMVKVETLMGPNVIGKQVYNGEVGIMVAQGQEQKLEGAKLEEMKTEAIMFPELDYAGLGYTLELTGKEKVDGKDAYKMTITSPTGKATTAYFNTASGLKVKQVTTSPMGNSTTTFADYKEIDGVKFPMAMTQSVGPQLVDIAVNSIEINKGIEDSVFNN